MAINRIQMKPSAADIDYPETSIDQVKGLQVYTATGTANALIVTTGADFKVVDGAKLTIYPTANNTGAITVNPDGKGAIQVRKPQTDGSQPQLVANDIKAYKAFEVFYNATATVFFLLARGSGTALASDLLASKTATTDAGDIVGTMVNRSTGVYASTGIRSVSTEAYAAIPANAYYGTGAEIAINDPDFVTSSFPNTKNIFGLQGTMVDRNTNQAPVSITPYDGVIAVKPADGWWHGNTVDCYDANFMPANIKSGVTLFGKVGTMPVGKQVASGTALITSGGVITVSGLGFTPTRVIAYHESHFFGGVGTWPQGYFDNSIDAVNFYDSSPSAATLNIVSGGFTLTAAQHLGFTQSLTVGWGCFYIAMT